MNDLLYLFKPDEEHQFEAQLRKHFKIGQTELQFFRDNSPLRKKKN